MRHLRAVLGFLMGTGLALVLACALGVRTDAAGSTLCVVPGGGGGCYASIQDAVDAADDWDTIRVAEGTYYETVVVTKSVTLEGGWNFYFGVRDWSLYVTTIDAERTGPVIWINAPVSPTIDGFVITGGDDSAHLGWGGGVKLYWSGSIYSPPYPGYVIIRNNVITDNVACATDFCQGHGGGIFVYHANALIEHNTIISNAARTDGDGGGEGGGVRVWSAVATLIDNDILSNTAVYSTTGLWTGRGGGVGTQYADNVVLEGNEIRGNVAAIRGDGYGGGVWANAYMYGNQILNNVASVHDEGYGGGVYAYYVLDFDGNLVEGNVASELGAGDGGGIYAVYLQSAQHNDILSNSADNGGGIYYSEYSGNQELYDNYLAYNEATGPASFSGGGGIASAADWVEIVGNEFYGNWAGATFLSAGGGLLINAGDQYEVRENLFDSNIGALGGAIAVISGTGTVAQNVVMENLSLVGGGMLVSGGNPLLDGNVVLSNTAFGYAGVGGGGLCVLVTAGDTVTVTNHIIARNATFAGLGGGINCFSGNCVLINNTIVDGAGGSGDQGVLLASSGGVHIVWNNIIAGHDVGFELASGSGAFDYNDYYDNLVDVSGTVWGTHHRTDDPQFADRLGADYHLTATSALIDTGDSTVNVSSDWEGDPRPRGGGVDIGADEFYLADSYVSQFTGSDTTGDGSAGSPFASVTKGLSETRTGGTVYVGRGTYTGRITITRDVSLLGGYHENTWPRNIDAYTSTLDAQGTGTVVIVEGDGLSATIEGFSITGGEASYYGTGGGVAVLWNSAAMVRYNRIFGNHALNGGGGVVLWGGEVMESVLDSNRIYDNVAEGIFVFRAGGPGPARVQQGPEPGGGVLVAEPARVINNWVYGNSSGEGGDGMAVFGGTGLLQVYHNTVVDNGGSGGVGIQLRGSEPRTTVFNNLIVGHGTGITTGPFGGGGEWDHNGFFDNVQAYASGMASGPNDVHGDPRFVDRPGRDYHLTIASPMAGGGTDLDVPVDLDGQERPLPAGTRPDLGANEIEQRRLFLPLVLRDSA